MYEELRNAYSCIYGTYYMRDIIASLYIIDSFPHGNFLRGI